jgi:hypothetical protein
LGGDPPTALGAQWAGLRVAALPPLIAYEGAGIWLFRRLRALGILDALPGDFREQLKALAFEAVLRSLRVEEEALATLRLFQDAGIPVVLIKGVARRALAPQYPYLDARGTNDVDLLLPAERIHAAYDLLTARGYESTDGCEAPRRDHHHLPALWNERRVAVELHSTTSSRISPALAWSRATDGGQALDWGGVPVRVPPPTELAWAAVTHAINDSIVHGHRLQHFLEVAALAAGPSGVDWSLLVRRTGDAEVYEEESGDTYPPGIARQWLHAALQFVAERMRPPGIPATPLDLESLFAWRLLVLESRARLGRALSERMLEEGARELIGLGPQRAPPGTRALFLLRRRSAGVVSRMAFRIWRLLGEGKREG